jgi:hypothetical protein
MMEFLSSAGGYPSAEATSGFLRQVSVKRVAAYVCDSAVSVW